MSITKLPRKSDNLSKQRCSFFLFMYPLRSHCRKLSDTRRWTSETSSTPMGAARIVEARCLRGSAREDFTSGLSTISNCSWKSLATRSVRASWRQQEGKVSASGGWAVSKRDQVQRARYQDAIGAYGWVTKRCDRESARASGVRFSTDILVRLFIDEQTLFLPRFRRVVFDLARFGRRLNRAAQWKRCAKVGQSWEE